MPLPGRILFKKKSKLHIYAIVHGKRIISCAQTQTQLNLKYRISNKIDWKVSKRKIFAQINFFLGCLVAGTVFPSFFPIYSIFLILYRFEDETVLFSEILCIWVRCTFLFSVFIRLSDGGYAKLPDVTNFYDVRVYNIVHFSIFRTYSLHTLSQI